MEKSPIIKIISKETFLKARDSGNYGEINPEAQEVIDSVDELDLLELETEMGSALRVISAKKLDENRFLEALRGEC